VDGWVNDEMQTKCSSNAASREGEPAAVSGIQGSLPMTKRGLSMVMDSRKDLDGPGEGSNPPQGEGVAGVAARGGPAPGDEMPTSSVGER